jgi:hypothetical protein
MSDKLKSAFELAMERLRQKDAERGEKETPLGKKQKEDIAELRRVYQAKIAEREIAWQSERRKAEAAAAADPEAAEAALRTAEEAFRRDREKLERERDSKIEAVRGGVSPGAPRDPRDAAG